MSMSSAIALAAAMVVLALLPSLSVMTVLARSASLGFRHGAATSLGIVAGDILYILTAIYGLALLAEQMAPLLTLLQYLGAAYLIWLGLSLWRASPSALTLEKITDEPWLSSFLAGFLLTLADQKAIMFYLSFFPAFVDLASLTLVDTVMVVAIAIIAVGGAKLLYAFLAAQARSLLPKTQISRAFSWVAGTMMIAVGIALLFKGRL